MTTVRRVVPSSRQAALAALDAIRTALNGACAARETAETLNDVLADEVERLRAELAAARDALREYAARAPCPAWGRDHARPRSGSCPLCQTVNAARGDETR